MLHQVKASAGSGKTYALTKEFLSLLRNAQEEGAGGACAGLPGGPCRWPDILAVTFTNKAAAEMKERVIRALKERAMGRGASGPAGEWAPAEAGRRLAILLRRLSALNIRTIDSLLHQLVRLSALELRLPPEFEPVFDEAQLFEPLLDALVLKAEQMEGREGALLEAACRAYLLHGGGMGFHAVRGFRAKLLGAFRFRLGSPEVPLPDPKAPFDTLNKLFECMGTSTDALESILVRDNLAPKVHFSTFLEKCLATKPSEVPPKSTYATKIDLGECLTKAGKERITPEAQQLHAAFRHAFTAYADGRKILAGAAALAPMLALADRLLEDLEAAQRRQGLSAARLWPGYVRRLLEEGYGAPEAFCRMGARLAHLLVDEFQDTNREQWDALEPLAVECLSKGGGLFYVGDLKQAIYSWRGGDPDLFEEVPIRPEIAAVTREVTRNTLGYNRRSVRDVVEFNNHVFGALGHPDTALTVARAMLPEQTPETVQEALSSSILTAFDAAEQDLPEERASLRGLVRLTAVRGRGREDLREQVGEKLKELFLDDLLLRRQPNEVAVLVRSNEEAAWTARRLIEWNVPVVTENSLLLAEHPLVRQTVAFLAFLDYPLDDPAFWEFVSGRELFGFAAQTYSDRTQSEFPDRDALNDWLANQEERPLFRAFKRDFSHLWEEFFEPFHGRAGLMGPYDTLCEFFGRFRVLENSPEDEMFLRRFLEVVYGAEMQGRRSLSAFLEFWREEGEREKAPLPDHMDAVRVMTIHKAKGLEFPVAVVPFHHYAPPRGGEPAQCTLDGETYLAPLSPEMGEVWHDRLIPALREQLNLLYVAWTRAGEELHAFITGDSRGEEKSPLSAALGVLLEPFDMNEPDAVYESGVEPLATPRTEEESPAPRTVLPPFTPPLPGERPMAWLPGLRIFRNSLDEEIFDERQRGIMAHYCLELLKPTGDAAADSSRAVGLALRAAPPKEHDRLRPVLTDMAAWLLSLPEMPRFLAGGNREQVLLDQEGSVHRADLYYEDSYEAVVVEYKTGRHQPEHREQTRRYLDLVSALPGNASKRVRGLLVYLDEKLTEEIVL
jgi:ATP-dependent helicase/nuclease subunit A